MQRFALVAGAAEPRPEIVVIAGDSGTGKTRIVQEFYRRLVEEREPAGSRHHPPELVPSLDVMGSTAEIRLEATRAMVSPRDDQRDNMQEPRFLWIATNLPPRREAGKQMLVQSLQQSLEVYEEARQTRRGRLGWALRSTGEVARVVDGLGDLISGTEVPDPMDGVGPQSRLDSRKLRAFRKRLDRAMGYLGDTERYRGDASTSLTPAVIVVDDAHELDEVGRAQLVELVTDDFENRRPLLLVLTTWLHRYRDPAASVSVLVEQVAAHLAEVDQPERLQRVLVRRRGQHVDGADSEALLQDGDLVEILSERFPDVPAREEIVARIAGRMRHAGATPMVVMRVCAQAEDRLRDGLHVDFAWAGQVAVDVEPELQRLLSQLATEERALLLAILGFGRSVLPEWLADADREHADVLVDLGLLIRSEETFSVAPQLVGLLGPELTDADRSEDLRGLRQRAALALPVLLAEVGGAEGDSERSRLVRELVLDRSVLRFAPEDSSVGQLVRILPDAQTESGTLSSMLTKQQRADVLRLAESEPLLTGHLTLPLVGWLINAGHGGGGYDFVAELMRRLLRGLPEATLGSELGRRCARSLCTAVTLDDVVKDISGDEVLQRQFVSVLATHATEHITLGLALVRCMAAGLVDDAIAPGVTDSVLDVARRWTRHARELLQIAPPDFRANLEALYRTLLTEQPDLFVAGQLLAISEQLEPATVVVVRDAALIAARSVLDEEDASDGDEAGPAARVSFDLRVALQVAAGYLWRGRAQLGTDEEVRRRIVALVVRVAERDDVLALRLLREAEGEHRDQLWGVVFGHASGPEGDELLLKLLGVSQDGKEVESVLRLLRERAGSDADLAARWLDRLASRRTRSSHPDAHRAAFDIVLRHAESDRQDLLAVAVRAAPDRTARQAALEFARSALARSPELAVAFVQNRVALDDLEPVRAVLRREVEASPRAALALVRIAEEAADLVAASAAMERWLTTDLDGAVQALLADPDPWITRLVAPGELLRTVGRRLRERSMAGDAGATSHLRELGFGETKGVVQRAPLASRQTADLLFRARRLERLGDRRKLLALIGSATAGEADGLALASATLELAAPGTDAHTEAIETLTDAVGLRPGVAATLVEHGVDARGVRAALRAEAASDPRSAVALHRIDPESARPFVAARRDWHPPSMLAWVTSDADAADRAGHDDPVIRAALYLVAPEERTIALPEDDALRDRVVDLLLEVDASVAVRRLRRADAPVVADLLLVSPVARPVAPMAWLLLLLELSLSLPVEHRKRVGRAIRPRLVGMVAWAPAVARAVTRMNFHERIGGLDADLAELLPGATRDALVELAPIVTELERPDVTGEVAHRLAEQMEARVAAGDGPGFVPIANAWSYVARRTDRFSRSQLDLLVLHRDDPRAAAAALRVGSRQLHRDAARHAKDGDLACTALLMRANLAGGDLRHLRPDVIRSFAERVEDRRLLNDWLAHSHGLRKVLREKGHGDLIDLLDRRAVGMMTWSPALAAAVLRTSRLGRYHGAARKSMLGTSLRSAAMAGRTALEPKVRGKDLASIIRYLSDPKMLTASRHHRFVLSRVMIARGEDVLTVSPEVLERLRRTLASRQDHDVVSAAANLLLADEDGLVEAVLACRRHDLRTSARFLDVLRALALDPLPEVLRARVSAVYDRDAPRGREALAALGTSPLVRLPDVVSAAVDEGLLDVEDPVIEEVRRLLDACAALGRAGRDLEGAEELLRELRERLPTLTLHAYRRRSGAALLADVADVLGYERDVTLALTAWGARTSDELLVRAARGMRASAIVDEELVDALRVRAPESRSSAQAFALVAHSKADRKAAASALLAHAEDPGISAAGDKLLRAHRLGVVGVAERRQLVAGLLAEDRLADEVLDLLLHDLEPERAERVAERMLARRELAGITSAVPCLSEPARREAFAWVQALPEVTPGRGELLMRLTRSDREVILAAGEVVHPDATPEAAVTTLFRVLPDPGRIALIAASSAQLRGAVLTRAKQAARAQHPDWVDQALANARLLITGRVRPQIHGALGALAERAPQQPEAAVALVDLLECCDDEQISVPRAIITSARKALDLAIADGRPEALVRALVPGPYVSVAHSNAARAKLDPGSPLARAAGLLAGRHEPLDQLVADRDVQDLFQRSCRYPSFERWRRPRVREFDERRDRLQLAVREAWPRMPERERVAALRAAPALVTALVMPQDWLQAFTHVPECVPYRMSAWFLRHVEQRPDARASATQLLREHGRDHLACAVALAQLDPSQAREARRLIEPFRQHSEWLVLEALMAQPEAIDVAQRLMAEPGDPLVDGLVELLVKRWRTSGDLHRDELRLLAGIASQLRPRQRATVRTMLRAAEGLGPAQHLEILAQLAEDPLHRREVWELARDLAIHSAPGSRGRPISRERLFDLVRLRPDGLDTDELRAIDRVLKGLTDLEALDVQLELRAEPAFPDDEGHAGLLDDVLAQADTDPLLAAVLVLRTTNEYDARQRAIEFVVRRIRDRPGSDADDRQLARIAPRLRPHERDELVAAVTQMPSGRALDRACAAVKLGLAERVEGSYEALLMLAPTERRAARTLAECATLPSSVDLGLLTDTLATQAPEDPALAAATLWWLSVSGGRSAGSLDEAVAAVEAAPRPEVFNAIIERPPSAAWLVRSLGTSGRFLWSLLDQALARAPGSVSAAVLAADLVAQVAPTDVALARAALRSHLEHPAAVRGLRQLARTPQQRIEAEEALRELGPAGVAAVEELDRADEQRIRLVGSPGAEAVQRCHEARIGRTSHELAAEVGEDLDRAHATSIVAAIEDSSGRARVRLWNLALRRLTHDLAFAGALASATLAPSEREALARVLRSRGSDGVASVVLVARTLGREATEFDRSRLATRLADQPRESLSCMLLVDPDTTWIEEVLAEDSSGRLRNACARAAHAAILGGADQPELLGILDAADPERFVDHVRRSLAELPADERILRTVGTRVAVDHPQDRVLIERVSERIEASGVEGLEDVLGRLDRLARRRAAVPAAADVAELRDLEPIADVRRWWELFGALLDVRRADLPREFARLAPDVLDRILRPGSVERMLAFARLEGLLGHRDADPALIARCLRLRRDLHAPGERLHLPPNLVERVEPFIGHPDVLVEAFHLPVSLLPTRHAIDLFALLESADVHIGRDSLPVAEALVGVLVSGHPFEDRVPADLRRRSLSLLESGDTPAFLIRAIRQGSNRALERLLLRLRQGDAQVAIALARRWPLALPDDPIVSLALDVPRGALEFERRVAVLRDEALRARWEPRLDDALARGSMSDIGCAARLLQRPGDMDPARVLGRLRDLVARSGVRDVVEALPALAQLDGDEELEGLVLTTLGGAIEDEDVALTVLTSGQRLRAGTDAGPLRSTATEVLWTSAYGDPVVAHVLHRLGTRDQRAMLRDPHPGSAPLAIAGLLDVEIDGEERSRMGTRLAGLQQSGALGTTAVLASIMEQSSASDRIVAHLPAGTVDAVGKALDTLAMQGSPRVALTALRWRCAARSRGNTMGRRWDDDAPEVKHHVLLAASLPGGFELLPDDRSVAEPVARWWSLLGFDSIARDLALPRSFAAREVRRTTSAAQGRVVRLLGSVAAVEWRGLLALVPGTELIASLEPGRAWDPGSPLEGVVDVGVEVSLRAVPSLDDLHTVLLVRPARTEARQDGGSPRVAEGDWIHGVVIGPDWVDGETDATLWLPGFEGTFRAQVADPEQGDARLLRAGLTFLEVPVYVGAPKGSSGRSPGDFELAVDLRGYVASD